MKFENKGIQYCNRNDSMLDWMVGKNIKASSTMSIPHDGIERSWFKEIVGNLISIPESTK